MALAKENEARKGSDIKINIEPKKALRYLGEYCEHTGIHGVYYLTEKRSRFER